jgi:hypothetical protein
MNALSPDEAPGDRGGAHFVVAPAPVALGAPGGARGQGRLQFSLHAAAERSWFGRRRRAAAAPPLLLTRCRWGPRCARSRAAQRAPPAPRARACVLMLRPAARRAPTHPPARPLARPGRRQPSCPAASSSARRRRAPSARCTRPGAPAEAAEPRSPSTPPTASSSTRSSQSRSRSRRRGRRPTRAATPAATTPRRGACPRCCWATCL